jgi:aryl-alcohol dehydrogenase-like predicted oxidoreductase
LVTPIGMGCMRLSTEADRDPERALVTLTAAADAGVTLFDTAHAYALSHEELGHNERLLGRALRGHEVRIVTKGGMARPQGRWVADGRASTIRADCEASLAALDGLPIDLYLLHAPDPRTPWETSVRALASLVDRGWVRRVGVSNVNRLQLDAALELAPIAAVEVALSPFEDKALQGGVVSRCIEKGLEILAHAPLGGPERAPRHARDEVLLGVARRHGVGGADVAIAFLRALHPSLTPLPGARHPETARACAVAQRLRLDASDLQVLRERFPRVRLPEPTLRTHRESAPEVVLVMGLQGSGKTESVATWVERGYERLNRDLRGGSLREVHRALDARLASGARRVVLDNTYVTRAQRRDAIEAATKHGARVRGIWRDTPVAQAQINVVLRMLAAHGRLLEPGELVAKRDDLGVTPQAQYRLLRQVEPPEADEGFAELEVVPFHRRPQAGEPAVMMSLDALLPDGSTPVASALERLRAAGSARLLIFGWRPDAQETTEATQARLRSSTGLELNIAQCTHPGGPPRCWCRPPLPGLPLAFAHAAGVDLARSVIVGIAPAHRSMAGALETAYEDATSWLSCR